MPLPLPPAFAKNQSCSVQLGVAWEKLELLIKLYTDGPKTGWFVCCAEEMGWRDNYAKRPLPPIHSQLPTVHHHSQSAITLPHILSCFPWSISASRTPEQARGSRNNVGDALRTVMPERPTAHSVGHSWPLATTLRKC